MQFGCIEPSSCRSLLLPLLLCSLRFLWVSLLVFSFNRVLTTPSPRSRLIPRSMSLMRVLKSFLHVCYSFFFWVNSVLIPLWLRCGMVDRLYWSDWSTIGTFREVVRGIHHLCKNLYTAISKYMCGLFPLFCSLSIALWFQDIFQHGCDTNVGFLKDQLFDFSYIWQLSFSFDFMDESTTFQV